ncbi:MAG: hypothetical protein JNJ98_14350 [Gemmatimonadetes bacterium]|nr:hypothetical protein [Gemmatimonadota bacterium]
MHNDKPAAFKGLIITALLLFVMSYGIVMWTNAKFASHSAAPAGAAKH